MELILEKGRPDKEAGRLEKEIRVYDLLDRIGLEYQRVDHAPAMTMEACRDIDRVLEATVCKNLFLCNRQKTQFYLLMIPGDKVFHTRDLSAQIGSARLSFGDPTFMEEFLDITPGSVSVMGLMNDRENRVRLLVDEEVLEGQLLGCHPCVNTSSLRLRTKDVFGAFLEAVHHDMTVVRL
nr:prolyl-tRNA synthetase associated domain-containing protein [uncultured Acetatifactor sp.]